MTWGGKSNIRTHRPGFLTGGQPGAAFNGGSARLASTASGSVSRKGSSKNVEGPQARHLITREISLTRGLTAIVDTADFDWLSQRKWHALGPPYYAIHAPKNGPSILMHRMILGVTGEVKVDHRDRNGLNNTRANLRPCTPRENARNRLGAPGTSDFKGVSFDTERSLWRAQIYTEDGRIFIGRYRSEEDAARAYDDAARLHFGEFAVLNFQESGVGQ